MNRTIEKQVYAIFYQMIADLKTPAEVKAVFTDLFSTTERQVIAKRVAIALFLDKGRSYENIKQTLKVSSATIASVQDTLANPGMQITINKIKAEEWAGAWAGKISSLVGKIMPKK